mgnify:CR=1 FL=1
MPGRPVVKFLRAFASSGFVFGRRLKRKSPLLFISYKILKANPILNELVTAFNPATFFGGFLTTNFSSSMGVVARTGDLDMYVSQAIIT